MLHSIKYEKSFNVFNLNQIKALLIPWQKFHKQAKLHTYHGSDIGEESESEGKNNRMIFHFKGIQHII